jgi:tetratricopeptide (TPR) repeat protein
LLAGGLATELALGDLDKEAVAEYLTRRFPENRFPAEMAEQLRTRSNGNPLFVVTMVDDLVLRGVIVERERGYETTDALRTALSAVPETVRRLIDQRLERLDGGDRELLESASLVGLEFSAAAAAAGADCNAASAERACERLVRAGALVPCEGSAEWPDGTVAGRYAFRHPLYQEVLVTTVTPRRKSEAHLRIGRALARAYGARAHELAQVLAFHFEVGGDRARAAHFRRLAAETEARRYSFVEAEAHLETGLELLAHLPPSAGRDQQEFLLQSALGPVRLATRGDGAPEVARCYERALELAGGAPPAEGFPILWGLWNVFFVHGEFHRALELAERNHAIAEASGDRVLRLEAHQSLWATHFFRGEWAAMLRHLDQGEPLYNPTARRRYADYRHDPKTSALSFRCHVLWSLGRIDESLAVSRRAVEHARALGDPMSMSLAMTHSAWQRLFRREPQACREEAEALIDYSTEQVLQFATPFGFQLRGWALCEQGEVDGAIADLERALELADALGTRLGRSHHYANLAQAKGRARRFAEALELIEKSKRTMAKTGERYNEPDVLRLEGELLVAAAGGVNNADTETCDQAEALLHAAIECARRQGAITLELRAATSLARLLRRSAKAESARAQLSELLGSFSEGFDTPDVQEALELAAPPGP